MGKAKAMADRSHGGDTPPCIPLSLSALAEDDALSSTASPSSHPRLCKVGHKPAPNPVQGHPRHSLCRAPGVPTRPRAVASGGT